MSKNYYRFPSSSPRRAKAHGIDGIFTWTIFIFLLMGFALFCWIGSFYVFGHPEKASNYHLLIRLHKLEEPQRFELTEAPRGEFLKPKQLFERFSSFHHREIRRENDKLLANFLRNYHQTHDLAPYVTGTYRILGAFPLTPKNFFYPGVVALLQSVDQPEVFLEQVFPATNTKLIAKLAHPGEVKKLSEPQSHALQRVLGNAPTDELPPFDAATDFQKKNHDIAPLLQALKTGQEIKFDKPLDLSAILHIEQLPNGHLLFTTLSLLYGSYGPTSSGPILFSLAPPTPLNIGAGLPVLSKKEQSLAEEQYSSYRKAIAASATGEAETPLPASPKMVLQIISSKPASLEKKLPPKNASLEKTAVTVTAPQATENTPKVARALPMSVPPVLPAAPVASPSPIRGAQVEPTLAQAPLPTASSAATEKVLSLSNQPALPSPSLLTPSAETSATEINSLYEPGRMPRGRFVAPSQFASLAEQGLAGERLYLQGDFAVTASSQDRSVLRYQGSSTSTLTPDRIGKIRLIVAYPTGMTPPAEGTTVSRNQDHPFMITEVKKGRDGTLNLYVKEIIK